jgi:hypothetical protein
MDQDTKEKAAAKLAAELVASVKLNADVLGSMVGFFAATAVGKSEAELTAALGAPNRNAMTTLGAVLAVSVTRIIQTAMHKNARKAGMALADAMMLQLDNGHVGNLIGVAIAAAIREEYASGSSEIQYITELICEELGVLK